MIFIDEKDFAIKVVRNCQNDVVYGHKKKEIPVGRLYYETSRFSNKVMVSEGVSMRGKTRIRFIDTSKTKVNSECYIKLIFYQNVVRFIQIMTLSYNKMGLRLT